MGLAAAMLLGFSKLESIDIFAGCAAVVSSLRWRGCSLCATILYNPKMTMLLTVPQESFDIRFNIVLVDDANIRGGYPAVSINEVS